MKFIMFKINRNLVFVKGVLYLVEEEILWDIENC